MNSVFCRARAVCTRRSKTAFRRGIRRVRRGRAPSVVSAASSELGALLRIYGISAHRTALHGISEVELHSSRVEGCRALWTRSDFVIICPARTVARIAGREPLALLLHQCAHGGEVTGRGRHVERAEATHIPGRDIAPPWPPCSVQSDARNDSEQTAEATRVPGTKSRPPHEHRKTVDSRSSSGAVVLDECSDNPDPSFTV